MLHLLQLLIFFLFVYYTIIEIFLRKIPSHWGNWNFFANANRKSWVNKNYKQFDSLLCATNSSIKLDLYAIHFLSKYLQLFNSCHRWYDIAWKLLFKSIQHENFAGWDKKSWWKFLLKIAFIQHDFSLFNMTFSFSINFKSV